MKQSLIITIIMSLLILTIQTVIPTSIRFKKKCPCGRGGLYCTMVIPQYCPPRLRDTAKPSHKIYEKCLKGFRLNCYKNKFGKEICSCKPIIYLKNKESN